MLSEKVIKLIGVSATLVGIGVSLVDGWVGDKKMESTIEAKIAEALAKVKE